MQMFAVYDTEYPNVEAMIDFFRTREEAEASIAGREKFTRATGDTPIPGHEYLAIREVERDSHPCKTCGAESTAKNPVEYPYCRNCHYTGIAAEDVHKSEIAPFVEAFPEAKVVIEHTGGGCFWLAAYFGDGPHSPYYAMTDSDAGVPDDLSEGWGLLVRYADAEDEGGTILLEDDWGNGPTFTREQVIAAISEDRKVVLA